MSSDEALLTVEEFAAALHRTVTPRTVRTLIRQGEVNAVRLGKRFYMTHDELKRFTSTCPANENGSALPAQGRWCLGHPRRRTADPDRLW